MSSLVKEDLAKRLFRPRRLRLQEFIEVEGTGAGRCYLCAAGTRGCMGPGDPHGLGDFLRVRGSTVCFGEVS